LLPSEVFWFQAPQDPSRAHVISPSSARSPALQVAGSVRQSSRLVELVSCPQPASAKVVQAKAATAAVWCRFMVPLEGLRRRSFAGRAPVVGSVACRAVPPVGSRARSDP
jgi:hypothetical protein